jgi:hypothetical protein
MEAGNNSMNAQENIKQIFAEALEKESPAARKFLRQLFSATALPSRTPTPPNSRTAVTGLWRRRSLSPAQHEIGLISHVKFQMLQMEP